MFAWGASLDPSCLLLLDIGDLEWAGSRLRPPRDPDRDLVLDLKWAPDLDIDLDLLPVLDLDLGII